MAQEGETIKAVAAEEATPILDEKPLPMLEEQSKAGVETNQQTKKQDMEQPVVVDAVIEKAVVEKMTAEPLKKEEETKQTAAGFQMDSVWEGLGNF